MSIRARSQAGSKAKTLHFKLLKNGHLKKTSLQKQISKGVLCHQYAMSEARLRGIKKGMVNVYNYSDDVASTHFAANVKKH